MDPGSSPGQAGLRPLTSYELIETTAQLREATGRLMSTEVSVVALDTEFMREKTYWPQLCLLQLAAGDELWLVDALAPGLDMAPLTEILASTSILKLFHASGQDLQVLHHALGVATAPIFDTQEAATLLGYPEQIGYGALVSRVLGVELGKAESFTDWARRPLAAEQLNYAADDVRWLLRLYPVMKARLCELGRERWLDEDFARKADPASYVVEPREQFRRLRRVSALKPAQLAVAREVAAWREVEAARVDRPKRWLLSDESVLEIARRAPRNVEALRGIRGVTLRRAEALREVLAAVARGAGMPRERWPRLATRARAEYESAAEVDLMVALVRARARENLLSMNQLASRAQLEELALWWRERRGRAGEGKVEVEVVAGDGAGAGAAAGVGAEVGARLGAAGDSPLLRGWRRAMVGEDLLRLLDGRLQLSLRDGQLVVGTVEVVGPLEREDEGEDRE
jgi:ribonuclease D